MRTFFLLCLVSFTISGCISYESDGNTERQQVNSVHTGETTAEWLTNNLGSPHSVRKTNRDTDIWHYEFNQEEKTHVSIFLIFNVSSENKSSSDYYFELHDGVVVDYWQD
jgi:hypothetical protein